MFLEGLLSQKSFLISKRLPGGSSQGTHALRVVFDESREDVVAVVRGVDGPILPARFNEIVAGQVGESVVRPEDENRLPGRPLTAFFSPQIRFPSCDVLSALQEAGLDGSSVACIQHKASGEILLTFRKAELKERFVRSSVFKVNGAPYSIQDVDCQLTFVQIFDAPHNSLTQRSFNN